MSRYDPYPDASPYCSTRKQLRIKVDCTPESVEQFKAALRHRKETEMPTPSYLNRWFGKPQPVRKENEMPSTWPPNATSLKVTDFFKEVLKENPPARTHLMTPQEVKDSLAAGEDPLLLSIKHWVQNAAHIKEHGSLPSLSSRGDTCALCAASRLAEGRANCEKCLLGISQGGGCSKSGTAWAQFGLNPSYDNAMNMVAVLASLKLPEPALPQFYIDGEGEGKVALRLEQGNDGTIRLRAVKGCAFWYYLLDIHQDGTLHLPRGINPDLGLDLDDAGRLRLEV